MEGRAPGKSAPVSIRIRSIHDQGFRSHGPSPDSEAMRQRFIQLLLAELLAFGSFVCGGLSVLGGVVTWSGDSQHSPLLSWCLVVAFALLAAALGAVAATRLRLVFSPRPARPLAWVPRATGPPAAPSTSVQDPA